MAKKKLGCRLPDERWGGWSRSCPKHHNPHPQGRGLHVTLDLPRFDRETGVEVRGPEAWGNGGESAP